MKTVSKTTWIRGAASVAKKETGTDYWPGIKRELNTLADRSYEKGYDQAAKKGYEQGYKDALKLMMQEMRKQLRETS